MKKLSYDEVKKIIESKDCKLISKEYINVKKQLEIQCSCGNIYRKSLELFKRNHLCSVCTKKLLAEKRKCPIDDIRSKVEKLGYKLLSTKHNGSKSKIKIQCNKGHIYETTVDTVLRGCKCPYCTKNRKKTYEEVKEFIESKGYKLLSKEYINSNTKLELECPEGHRFKMIYNAFYRGQRCPVKNKKVKHSYEYIKSVIEKEGYTLLSTEYKRIHDKLKVRCNNGHEYEVTYGNFSQGNRCPYCSNRKRKTVFDIKKLVESEGYKLVSTEYKNNKSKVKLKCPNGHVYEVKINDFQQGSRCPMCAKNHSKAEIEIYDLIKSYFPDTILGNRKVLHGLELDIYVLSKKIAFEYCGLFWHSEQQGKRKNYHLNKLNECNKQGIDLVTIFEDEYINRHNIVVSRIKSKLGIYDGERIFARKCKIKEIDTATKNIFLNKYHLQGTDNSSIKLGAFYNNRLVSVMTFSIPSIAKGSKNNNYTYELNRFCSICAVIGIASKLFKYFIRHYEFKEVFSFGDKRWSTGNVYKKLGFKKIYDTKPNYWYIVNNNRVHRFGYRKSELKRKLNKFNPELTEYQNMLNNGFDRIWDCGSVKWKFTADVV